MIVRGMNVGSEHALLGLVRRSIDLSFAAAVLVHTAVDDVARVGGLHGALLGGWKERETGSCEDAFKTRQKKNWQTEPWWLGIEKVAGDVHKICDQV